MKKAKEQDERLLYEKRKIGNETLNIVVALLFVSVFVQQYIYNAPFSQYSVEVCILIFTAIYFSIRFIFIGGDVIGAKKNKQISILLISFISGIIVSIVTTYVNYLRYSVPKNIPLDINTFLVAGVTFLIATTGAFFILEIMYFANKKRQSDIDKQMNIDEEQ